jgi:hypothetical protein
MNKIPLAAATMILPAEATFYAIAGGVEMG